MSHSSFEAAAVAALESTALFSHLPPERRRELAAIAAEERAQPGQQIVAEGTTTSDLFFVVSGEVEIARKVARGDERHRLRTLGPRESFGELGLLEEQPASASVYATAPTSLLVLPLPELRQAMARNSGFDPLFRGLAEQLDSRLRSLTDVTVSGLEREVAALRARISTGTMVIAFVAFMAVFTLSLSFSVQLAHAGLRQLVVFGVSLSGLAAVGAVIRVSQRPLSFWGITTREWRPAVRDALLYSLPLIALMLATKWALIHSLAAWKDVPLLAWTDPDSSRGLRQILVENAVYVLLVVPLQEFIVRGCIQGALEEFLVSRRRALWAIVTSNLVFSMTHAYLSPQFALLTLVPGLQWGWLYHRRRSLVGPILSHALVGVVALDVVGIFELLT